MDGEDMLNTTTPLPLDSITITGQYDSSVLFTITQLLEDAVGLAIKYENDLESTCDIYKDVTFGTSLDYEAQCINGYTRATVVAYMDADFDPDDCEACQVDDLSDMGGQFCAYSVEIPCETMSVECGEPSAAPSGSFYPSSAPSESPSDSSAPSESPSTSPSESPSDSPSTSPSASPSATPTTSPSSAPSSAPSAAPTRCPRTQPILIDTIGSSPFPDGMPPIEITYQNTSHVSFKVTNTWETTFTNVYTQYHQGGFGETECLEEENVESFTEVDEYTAVCMKHVPISIVNVWVVDGNSLVFSPSDDAEIPECCHPPEFSQVPIVQYTFKLNCTHPCPPEEGDEDYVPPAQRRLSSEKSQRKIEEPSLPQPKAVSSADKPSTDGKEGHFCVSEDYPCGDDGSRVNVCHYSARDGYKTFCVPEADSDVLAFYKKDYCGACVRGFGEKTARK